MPSFVTVPACNASSTINPVAIDKTSSVPDITSGGSGRGASGSGNFNDGSAVKGELSNRKVVDTAGNDITADVLTALNNQTKHMRLLCLF